MKRIEAVLRDKPDVFEPEDDPAALREKGKQCAADGDPVGARKFFTFASVLGDRDAHVLLAKLYEREERLGDARDLYALAHLKGDASALPEYARLLTRTDEKAGLDLLKLHAIEGNPDCIRELIAFYKNSGEQREVKFWSNWLERVKKTER